MEENKLSIPYEEKQKGTVCFRKGQIEEASKCFAKALLAFNFLLKDNLLDSQETVEKYVQEIQVPCLLNLSVCYVALGTNFQNAKIHCTDVLSIQPHNVKALYKRAQAETELGEYEQAESDLKKAIELDPGNSSVLKAQKSLKKAKAAHSQKLKKMYQKALTSEEPRPESFWSLFGKSFLRLCKKRNKPKTT